MSDDGSDWGADAPQETTKEETNLSRRGQPNPEPEESKGAEDEDGESSWVCDGVSKDKKSEKSDSGAKVEKQVTEIIAGGQLGEDEKNDTWGNEKSAREQESRPRRRGNRESNNEQAERGYDGNRRTRDYNNRGNQEGGFRRRGNRYEDNENGDEQNRRGRGYNREERGEYRGRGREGGDFRRNREDNGDYHRGDRGDRGGRGRGGYRGPRNDHQGYDRQGRSNQQIPSNQPIVPQGRKCWPQCSIYLLGKKLTLSFRQLQQFSVGMLVVPYITLKFQLYPGYIVNNSPIRYKEKLERKHSEGQCNAPGDVYVQKAKDLGCFQAITFLKIDEKDQEESFKKGVKNVLEIAERISDANKDTNVNSILFPVGQGIENPSYILEPLLTYTENLQKIKEIYVGCNNDSYFLGCIGSFHDQLKRLFNENEVCKQ